MMAFAGRGWEKGQHRAWSLLQRSQRPSVLWQGDSPFPGDSGRRRFDLVDYRAGQKNPI